MASDGLCLDQDLVTRLQEFADRAGMSPQEALEVALGLGLEGVKGDEGRLDASIDTVERTAEDLVAMVSMLGPPLLGILRLLVTWAAREGFGVSEDELVAEIMTAAREEWALNLAERGILLSAGSRARP